MRQAGWAINGTHLGKRSLHAICLILLEYEDLDRCSGKGKRLPAENPGSFERKLLGPSSLQYDSNSSFSFLQPGHAHPSVRMLRNSRNMNASVFIGDEGTEHSPCLYHCFRLVDGMRIEILVWAPDKVARHALLNDGFRDNTERT